MRAPFTSTSTHPGTSRLEAFSDGVFSIGITLLILEIRVPDIPLERVAQELPGRLAALWPALLSYAMSFVIVGIYWIGHNAMFNWIRRSDRRLLWLNLLFLMCVAFIPFPTALISRYGAQPITLAIYGACLSLAGLMLELVWWYATHRRRLVDPDIPPDLVRTATRKLLAAPVIYLISIGLAFVSVEASAAIYILVPILYILPSHIDRFWTDWELHGTDAGETRPAQAGKKRHPQSMTSRKIR